jgi:hypothetical protein
MAKTITNVKIVYSFGRIQAKDIEGKLIGGLLIC